MICGSELGAHFFNLLNQYLSEYTEFSRKLSKEIVQEFGIMPIGEKMREKAGKRMDLNREFEILQEAQRAANELETSLDKRVEGAKNYIISMVIKQYITSIPNKHSWLIIRIY